MNHLCFFKKRLCKSQYPTWISENILKVFVKSYEETFSNSIEEWLIVSLWAIPPFSCCAKGIMDKCPLVLGIEFVCVLCDKIHMHLFYISIWIYILAYVFILKGHSLQDIGPMA